MRSLPTQVLDLIEAGRFSIRYLVRFELDSGPTGIWTGHFGLDYGGITYAPLAGNVTISEIPASTELDSDRVIVTISNLMPAVTTIIANEVWHQRPCTLFVAFLNDAGEAFHAEARFSGFLDTASVSDAANDLATVTLTIESNSRELSRSNGDTRADASQRRRSAADGFFKHATNAATDSQIYWGRKGPQYPAKAVVKR